MGGREEAAIKTGNRPAIAMKGWDPVINGKKIRLRIPPKPDNNSLVKHLHVIRDLNSKSRGLYRVA